MRYLKPCLAVLSITISGCQSLPKMALPGTLHNLSVTKSRIIQQRIDHAKLLLDQGFLRESYTEWGILLTLAPGDVNVQKNYIAAKTRIKARSAYIQDNAQRALRSAQHDLAASWYLKLLALEPGNEDAIALLRSLDYEQTYSLQVSKHDAQNRQRRAGSGNAEENYYLQSGQELIADEKFEEGIAELNKYLSSFPNDKTSRHLLAATYSKMADKALQTGAQDRAYELLVLAQKWDSNNATLKQRIDSLRRKLAQSYYRKGVMASNNNLKKAIEYWETSLHYDPSHLMAQIRHKNAVKMQSKLEHLDN